MNKRIRTIPLPYRNVGNCTENEDLTMKNCFPNLISEENIVFMNTVQLRALDYIWAGLLQRFGFFDHFPTRIMK